jgi:8-oxo-dGTP pyrophosphatase MutT (NUDIX family)
MARPWLWTAAPSSPMATSTATPPIPASTLISVRPRGREPEILLLKRSAQARFMPNAYVFAGGALDANDAVGIGSLCPSFSDAQASKHLSLPQGGLKFYMAAIRESFEECGLLHAIDGGGNFVDLNSRPRAELHDMRSQLSAGRIDLASLCTGEQWRLAPEQLFFYSHWITPPGPRRRFDTRFFIAAAPPRQSASLAGTEMSDLVWRTPAEALSQHADGELLLMLPTHAVLSEMAQFDDIESLLEFASRRTGVVPITPELPPI